MSHTLWRAVLVGLIASVVAVAAPAREVPAVAPPPRLLTLPVTEVPQGLREAVKLDPFYQKHVDLEGLPILSSAKVSDEGLREASYLIRKMLTKRPDILKEMAKRGVRFVVMAPTEMTTDVPEQRH